MRWILATTCVCTLLIVLSNNAVGQDAAGESVEAFKPEAAVARLLEVCDAVTKRHVEPPVMQQLVLSASRAIYESRAAEVPQGLHQRISKLSTKKQFESLLESVVGDKSFDADAVMDNLLSRIPGVGTLTAANAAKIDAQLSANKYVGVGIALGMQNDRPKIMTCFYGGPGYEAGVKSNDTILEIDGRSTAGKALTQIVKELRGEKGSDVALVLKHPTAGERKIVVTRNVAFIPTVTGTAQDKEGKWLYQSGLHPDFAVFRIDRFGASTAHEFRKLDSQLSDKNPAGIILDLRAGGGDLHNVVMVADQFLDAGMIGSTKIGEQQKTYRSQDDRLFQDIPMVVLTSSTASTSSTFLAAALQDRGRAIVVGEPTNGVSYVRSQVDLENGDKLIIPSGYVRRGNGTVLFAKTNPTGMARVIASQATRSQEFDRKSANVVVPDHVVFPNRNSATAQAIFGGERPKSGDAVMVKAIAVLKKLSQEQAQTETSDKNTAG